MSASVVLTGTLTLYPLFKSTFYFGELLSAFAMISSVFVDSFFIISSSEMYISPGDGKSSTAMKATSTR